MKVKRRVGALVMSLVLVMSSFASYAEEAIPTDDYAAEQAAAEQAAAEQAAAEQAAAEQAAVEQAAAEQAAAEQAAAEQAAAEQAAAEQAAAEQAAAEQAAAEQAAAEQAAAEQAAAEQAAAEQAAAEQAAAEAGEPQEEAPAADTEAEPETENAAEEAEVRKNTVTFTVEDGATVTVNGVNVTNGIAQAEDGKIVFTVTTSEGYEITSVLVDGSIDARKNEETPEDDDYIIEGIQTDETVVSVSTEQVETERTLIDQTISATIYTDASYSTPLSDGTSITLSGVMPEGAEAKAYPVSVEIDDVIILAAYDITIFDTEDEEYQPEQGALNVKIENAEIREALADEEELTVYHMETIEDKPEEIATIVPEASVVTFAAEHFSIYIVGEDDNGNQTLEDTEGNKHYVYNVTFYADLNDDGVYEMLSTQTLSAGEYVEQPGVPDKEGYIFKGWYTQPEGGTQYDFSEGLPEMSGNTGDVTLDLYAQYEGIRYVHYMIHAHTEGDEETNAVYHTEAYTADQTLDTSTAEQLYLTEGYLSFIDPVSGATVTTQAVTGWVDAEGNEWTTGDTIDWNSIDGDLELYPVVESAYWIYFNMNGVHDVEDPAPQYVLATAGTIGELPTVEASGYTFDGWYTEADGGTLVTSSTTLTSLPQNDDGSITLYAHWTEANVAYTVNFWRQKATDGQEGIDQKTVQSGEEYSTYIQYYDYAESIHISAEDSTLKTGQTNLARADFGSSRSGMTTTYTWDSWIGYGSVSSSSTSAYNGFEYNQARTENDRATKTMAADGSTVINIFYDRVTITWTFQHTERSGWSSTTVTDGTLIGLYDTNITPTNGSEAAGTLSAWPDNYNGYYWNTNSTGYSFEARFIIIGNSATRTFTPGSTSPNSNKYVHYYLEVTNEATQVDTTSDAYTEAVGYGIDYTKTVDDTKYVYTRTINISSNFTIESKFIGYYYLGYTTSNSATSIESTSTSIGNGNLYFLFNKAYTYTITLFSDSEVVGVNSAGEAIETSNDYTYKDVKYGEDLSKYPFPETLDGATWGPAYYYHFTGTWYEDPYLTSPFTATTMPNNNLAAYADWELDDITVTFVTNTSDVEAPDAQNIKATETATDPGELEREGYTHVGWVDQNGKVFNFSTVLYTDTTLTAIWKADDETGYQLHYNLNVANSNGLLDPDDYPDGADVSTNTEHFEAGDYEDLWTIEHAFSKLSQEVTSKFICWNTAADGTGTSYYPGDEIYIDGDTTLYAIWAHENESTLVLVHNYPTGYTEGTEDNIITQSNLTDIDIEEESGLHYHDEITVTDAEGTVHTYRFDGWSTSSTAYSDADVNVDADATVKVDTLYTSTENVNYLYAVWLEVHDITVTKEVVDSSIYPVVSESQTFDFSWSFIDGEGKTNENEEEISITNKGTFTIYGVATDEKVTITETPVTGFTTSYNGAQSDVVVDGNGTYTFTMTDSTEGITVTNTVETTEITAIKVWNDDNNRDGLETDVNVQLKANDSNVGEEVTLNDDDDWCCTWTDLPVYSGGEKIEYTVEEVTSLEGYEVTVTIVPETDDEENGTGNYLAYIVNSHEDAMTQITVNKEWKDGESEDRPTSVTVQLYADEEAYGDPVTLDDSNEWSYTWEDLYVFADGEQITYTVTEAEVDGYTTSIGELIPVMDDDNNVTGYTITVTNTRSGETVISVEKEWVDNNNAYNTRPENLAVTITGSDGKTYTLTLSDENDWSNTLNKLPMYDSEGKEVTYTVTEAEIENYDGDVVDNEDGTYTITNTLTGETEIAVEKKWVDSENKYETRPDSITVTITGSNESAYTLTLSEANNWSATQSNLPMYTDEGVQITYTATEESVTGYTSTGGDLVKNDEDGIYGVEFTNTLETVDVEGSKTWDDDEDANGNRPESITITLLADDEELDSLTVEPDADGNWTWSFTDLPKYQSDGETEVVYTITEDEVTGYTTEVNGYDVTNSTETTEITAIKVWNDDNNRDGLETDVNVQLKANGSNVGEEVTLNDGDDWSYTWTDLPVYSGGEEIEYTVEEVTSLEGYEVTVTIVPETDDEGNETGNYLAYVINTHEDAMTQITVNKEWLDDNSEDRPTSVTVQLYADEEAYGDPVTLDDSNSWSYTWEDLYVFADGEQITYTVTEAEVDGYTTSIGELIPVTDEGSNVTGYTVTVTNTRSGETEVSVEKVWDDNDNVYQTRPRSVTANITGNSNTYTLTLSSANGWSDTYSELPKYDSNGKKITYTVTEESVTGYTGEVEEKDDGTFTITNTLETVDITGSKTWNNEDDPDKPTSITISLLADNRVMASVTVTASENWAWSFTGYPKYNSDGTEINYTITENAIGNYTTTVKGYDVTNTYTPETTTITITKDWDDDDNRDGKRPEDVAVTLTGTNGFSQDVTLNDENSWKATVDVAMNDNDGSTVKYSVTEATVTDYKDPVITSTDGYNFTVTNSYEPTTVDGKDGTVTIKKEWNDADNQDGIRPDSVTVTLIGTVTTGEGEEAETETVYTSDPTELSEENEWTASISGLYKYANGGEEISYSVTEADITIPSGHETGYTAMVSGGADEDNDYTFTVTNTHEIEVYGEDGTLTVNKVWVDDDNRDGLETDSIIVQLETDQVATGQTVTLNDENEWTASFTELPKYADGEEINYSVEEVEVPDGYTATYTQNGDDWTITNTHDDYLVSELTITKVWDDADNQDGIRPDSVDVELQIGGVQAADKDGNPWMATLTKDNVDADGNWTITVDDHPVFLDAEGQEISYTLHEDTVTKGYEATDGTVEITATTDDEGNTTYIGAVTITNTHTPETITVSGTKTWDYGEDPDTKPASITIHLLADGTEIDSATVTEEDEWVWRFTDLPKNASGKEITYTITEDAIENYTTEINGYDVTNTYNPEMTTVTVSKAWDDDSDRDGLRPNDVTITLTGSTNSFSEDIVLNEGNSWTATVDVPMYDNNGGLVEYSVSEEQVDNYDEPVISSTSGTSAYNFIVTNKHTPATVDGKDGTIKVEKVWDDADDQDGIRPESVTVTLYADEDVAHVFTLNEQNEWTDSVSGMYMYANGGEEITYSVTEAEISVPEGHTGYDEPVIEGGADEENDYTFTVTNKHTPELVNETGKITVEKNWVDDDNRDGMETAIEVQLYANDDAIGDPVSLTGEEDNWTYTWDESLPKYADGEEITYSVQETGVPEGYTVAYSGDVESGFVITNTHESKTVSDLTITKVWDDEDNQDGIRPDNVDVELQIDGSAATGADGENWTATLTKDNVDADGNWTITVDDHPVFVDENGAEITYTLHEDTVTEGYEATDGTVEITATTDDDGNTSYTGAVTIINTHTPETVDVEGSKTWDYGDDPDEKPTSITIRLLADGTEMDSATVTEDEDWAWSFTDLPKYRDGGTEIVYTITEDAVENYTTTYGEDSYDVTNTYDPEETTVTITKNWDDDDDRDGKRPGDVTVSLTGTDDFSQDITLNESNGWTDTVDVPMYDNDGSTVEYSVTEATVTDYKDPVITSTDGYNFTVTNTYEPEWVDGVNGTITVEKVWDDEDDQDGIRPESVTVTLYADGEVAEVFTLDEENDWTDSVSGMYKYANGGQEIDYSVSEAEIALPEGHEDETGYTATYAGGADEDSDYTFTVTNTHEIEVYGEDGTLTVNKVWNDDGNRDGLETDSITVQLEIDQEATGDELTLSSENSWTGTFTDLPKYAEGEEINYSVEEAEVPDGYTVTYTQSGDDWIITNTHEDYLVSELTITKVWDDENNQDGIRPDSVDVELQIDGSTATGANGESWIATLTEDDAVSDNEWTITVDDHPVFLDAEGQQITYMLHEDTETDGYEAADGTVEITTTTDDEGNTTYSGAVTITNTHTPETVDVEGSKTWNDSDNADGNRPANITIRLYADGVEIQSKAITAADEWAWSFADLPKYRDGGVEIEYTITEDAIYHYSTTYDGYDVTNTHTYGQTSVTVTKIWDDVSDTDEVRPKFVTIDLMADDEQIDTLILSGEGNVWTGSFTELDIYDGETPIEYTIVEEGVGEDEKLGEDYTSHIDGDASTGFIITNYHEVADWSVEKKLNNSGSGEDGAFKLGETAEFTITVTNTGNIEVGPIDVTEILEGATFVESEDYELKDDNTVATIETLPRNGVVILYATYTIEEKDLGQELMNSVTTDDGSKEPGPGDETPVPTEDPDPHLTVTKTTTSEPANGSTYALGEEITYEITVTNDGNRTIENIIVEDPLTEDTWTIESLAPGGSWTESAAYEVKEQDILKGSVVNEATVTAEDPDNPGDDVPNTPGTDEEPTDEKNDHLTVTKVTTSTPENGSTYALGEEITYTITVTNDGNVTLTDIVVTDEMTGDTWPAEGEDSLTLAPGESATFEASYTVTEEDIENGSVLNEATATGTDPEDKEPDDPWEGTDEDPTDTPHPSLYVEKTADVEEGYVAALGDEITYIIYVLNNGNETLTDITVTDEMTGGNWTIESLAPGDDWTVTTTYVVTEKDILAGSIENVAAVEAENPNDPEDPVDNEGTVDIPTEDPNGHITVTKETTSEPANGEAYVYGEEITYEITVTNDGNLTITDITVTDELTGDIWPAEDEESLTLAPGESETFEASYTVTLDDLGKNIVNEATVEGTSPDPDEPEVPSEPGTKDVPTIGFFPMDEEIVPGNDDEASPDSWLDKESVNEYESIEIEMSTTLPNVSGELLAEEDFNMTFHNQLDTQLVLDDLDSDFTVDINGTPVAHQYYEIDMTQASRLIQPYSISDGCTFHVNVDLSALYNDGVINDEDLGTSSVRVFFYADLETTDVNGSYTSTAWYDLAAGDEVIYISDQSVVTVYTFEIIVELYGPDDEPLAGATFGLYYDEDCTQPVSRNGEDYVVTTDENGQGMFVGIAEGTYYVKELESPDGYEGAGRVQPVTLVGDEDDEHIFTVVFANEIEGEPEWTVEKTLTNSGTGENGAFKLGETAEFTITVTNTGEIAVEEIEIAEVLDGAAFKASEDDSYTLNEEKTVATVRDLAAGDVVELYAEYTIEEKDLGTDLVNSVTTSGGDPDEPTPGPGTEEPIPTEEMNGHLTVTKEVTSTPENGETYALDEEIEYKITVTNDGNLTITDITVKDELTKDEWAVESLAPGESKSFDTSYKVTEADLENGSVLNEATATGTSPDPGATNVPSDPGDATVPTETPHPSLYVEKTADVEKGHRASLGEEITYTVKVVNNGNVTLRNITVSDDLTGDTWTIARLKPNESKTFTTAYTVTEEDILAGSIVNVATAKAENPEDPDGDGTVDSTGSSTVRTEKKVSHLGITKTATSEPKNKEAYTAGETIAYMIVVTNDGDLSVSDIVVEDPLTGDTWTIDVLKPGDSATLTTEYEVTQADVSEGSVVNTATVTGTSADPDADEVEEASAATVKTTGSSGSGGTGSGSGSGSSESGSSGSSGESTTASSVKTADETPVGPVTGMLAAALLVLLGSTGYTCKRRRAKKTDK